MARHKNLNWTLPEGTPHHIWESIHAALLMDIRDELQRLNAAIWFKNFQQVPAKLDRIARNTTKRPRKVRGGR